MGCKIMVHSVWWYDALPQAGTSSITATQLLVCWSIWGMLSLFSLIDCCCCYCCVFLQRVLTRLLLLRRL